MKSIMNKKSLIALFLISITGLTAEICRADVVTLKNTNVYGQNIVVEGKITDMDNKKALVIIEVSPGKKRLIYRTAIKNISMEKPPWEVYEEKKNKTKDSAAQHYKLGEWCKEHHLKDEARQEWEKAIELEPNHEKARKALGYVKGETGNWQQRNTREMIEKGFVKFEGEWVPKDKFPELMEKGGYALSFKVALEEDVNDAFLKEFQQRLKESASLLWQVTQGQFYVSEFSVSDKASEGDIVIRKGFAHTNDTNQCQAYGHQHKNERIWLPGEYFQYSFLHEVAHARFGLHDEKEPNQCPVCLMCGYSNESVKNLRYCDETNHKGKDKEKQDFQHENDFSCWEQLLQYWPRLVGSTNMNFVNMWEGSGQTNQFDARQGLYGPPETKITVKNN